MPKKAKKAKKSDCSGCRNDFYNYGGKTCWNLDDATLEKKKLVHINDVPPWDDQEIRTVPTCWNGQQFIAINPTRVR